MTAHAAAGGERSLTKVAIIGLGYVGLPVAIHAAEAGFIVTGFEISKVKADQLNSGDSYIEDIAGSRVRAALESGSFRATTDPADIDGFDIAIITVPTPLRETLPDLSFIEDAAEVVGAALKPGALVVLESTTYPGTTDELLVPRLAAKSGLTIPGEVLVGYSPERIDPGNSTWGLQNTPKVVSGINEESARATADFYGAFVERTVSVSSTREAELCKLLENTFRHVNIALINELAIFAGDLGIDIWEAVDAAATKPFGFMRFEPGPGVGGHCLPIDPSYLSWAVRARLGETFRFVELANDINAHMPDYVIRRVTRALNDQGLAVRNSRILLLGLAYKKDTGDARESPGIVIAKSLAALGAVVAAVDPHVDPTVLADAVRRCELTKEELQSADLTLVLTNHGDFDLDLVTTHSRHVFDCRHASAPRSNVEFL